MRIAIAGVIQGGGSGLLLLLLLMSGLARTKDVMA